MPGYVGGTVVARLLNHPNRKSFEITALVRDESKAKTLESKFGVKTVIGSHQDLDKVAIEAEAAHIVFNIVSDSPRCLLPSSLTGTFSRMRMMPTSPPPS